MGSGSAVGDVGSGGKDASVSCLRHGKVFN